MSLMSYVTPTPKLEDAGVLLESAVWWNSSTPSCRLGRILRVTTHPARQEFLELSASTTQPPPPKVDHPLPQSFCAQIGRRRDGFLSPTALEGLGKKTRGKTLTSQPTVS